MTPVVDCTQCVSVCYRTAACLSSFVGICMVSLWQFVRYVCACQVVVTCLNHLKCQSIVQYYCPQLVTCQGEMNDVVEIEVRANLEEDIERQRRKPSGHLQAILMALRKTLHRLANGQDCNKMINPKEMNVCALVT